MSIPAADDPLFRPISIEEAMARTGRSRRTLDRWMASGNLRVVRFDDLPDVVLVERDVIEMERAARAARRQGRPSKRAPSEPPS